MLEKRVLQEHYKTRLEILSRPKAPLDTIEMLSIFSQATLEILPRDSPATPELLLSYSRATPELIPSYYQVTLELLPSYYRATPELPLSYSELLSRCSQGAPKLLLGYS